MLIVILIISISYCCLVNSNSLSDSESTNEIYDCAANLTDEQIMFFNDTTIEPSPILIPGKIRLNTTIDIKEDLPEDDLYIRFEIIRTKSPRIRLPCVDKVGSCKYDLCQNWLPKNGKKLCKYGICGCPIKAGVYNITDFELTIPKFGGNLLFSILSARYSIEVTFFNDESKIVYGSICGNVKLKKDD